MTSIFLNMTDKELQEEHDDIIQQEIERDEREREMAEEAHKAMFEGGDE